MLKLIQLIAVLMISFLGLAFASPNSELLMNDSVSLKLFGNKDCVVTVFEFSEEISYSSLHFLGTLMDLGELNNSSFADSYILTKMLSFEFERGLFYRRARDAVNCK